MNINTLEIPYEALAAYFRENQIEYLALFGSAVHDELRADSDVEAFYEHAVGTSAGSLSPRTNWMQLTNYEFILPSLEDWRHTADVLLRLEGLRKSYQEALAVSRQLSVSLVAARLDSDGATAGTHLLSVIQLGPANEPVLKNRSFGSKPTV